MNAIRASLTAFLLNAAALAQGGFAVAPAGQPALAGIRPTLQNTLPLAIAEVAGNPNFRIHCAVVTPAVPVGSPMFLLLGPPAAAAFPVPPALLSPAYGMPGWLPMAEISLIVPMTVAGTYGTPPYSLPIPAGVGPLGHFLTAQIAVLVPGGFGLTGATGIVL